jgi:DNA-binding NarL/FixJ family response regulator
MKRAKIVVIEDNRLLREGLTAMLKEQPDLAVVGSLSSGDAFLREKRMKPDVILLDFALKSGSSLRCVQSIRVSHPGTKIIIVDLAPIQPSLVDYVEAGVAGFVLKDATFKEFLQTIRDVSRGKKVLPPLLTSSLFSELVAHSTEKPGGNPFSSVRMTGREREVIELIAGGLSNKQIAARLNLAVDTVKSHVHNILEKLQLHTRLEIASYRHVRGRDASIREGGSSSER